MKIWAIADLHLSFGTPDKSMDVFGEKWENHPEKISEHWHSLIHDDDLVLIAGDISWGKHDAQVAPDLEWIDALPGKKVISKGNHDYWWPSNKKLSEILPPSIQFVNKNGIDIGPYSICGTRLWDHKGISFGSVIDFTPNPRASHPEPPTKEEREHDEKIYASELVRLELALQQLNQEKIKIAMVHYPPLSANLDPSPASLLLEKYNVDICVFGHLHNVHPEVQLFDCKHNGIHYLLTACDYLEFKPIQVFSDQSV